MIILGLDDIKMANDNGSLVSVVVRYTIDLQEVFLLPLPRRGHELQETECICVCSIGGPL